MRYRTKPSIVEAFQWGRATIAPTWLTQRMVEPSDPYDWLGCLSAGQCTMRDGDLYLAGTSGVKVAKPGDWIVQGAQGEVFVLDPMTFEAGFEAV